MKDYLQVANSPVVMLLCAAVILFVLVQAVFFMRKAWKMGISIGMSSKDLKKVLINSATFSILPSLSILIILVILMPNLGAYFPWLRLSVIGSGVYENMAADTTAKAFGLTGVSDPNFSLEIFVSAMWVMTIGIIWGPLYTALGSKKIQKGVSYMKSKNEKTFKVIFSTMFVALLAVFIAPYISTPFNLKEIGLGARGIIPLLVVIFSGLSTMLLSFLSKKLKSSVLEDFSFPLSLVAGMLSAILFGQLIPMPV